MSDSATSEPIKGFPIADGLDVFRTLFNSIYKDPSSESTDDSIDQLEQEKLRSLAGTLLDALARLLPEAANTFKDHFKTLRSSIAFDDRTLDRIKPLVKAALADEPDDTLIWDLVSQATVDIKTPSRLTALPSTFDSTPVIYSSASQQGTEQTRKLIEARVFEEVRACTYRDVEGFFEKYFEDKDWTGHAQDVYESIKAQHINGKWVDLQSPSQARVLNWLFKLQDNLLSEAKRRYYTIDRTSELTGGEAKRQIDLLIKRKSGKPSDTEHNWKDIEVIGELKASGQGVKGPLIQLARYARDVFASQPTRRYLHAFTICGSKMEVWVFDRSGCYSPGIFDIHDHPERFIRVLAGYIMMSEDELGLDTLIRRDGDSHFINIEGNGGGGGMKRLQLRPEPLTHQRAIVSRGTSCYLVRDPDSDDWDHVAKFSWPSGRRRPEADLLGLANQRGVEGIARLSGHYDITSTNNIRSGIIFKKPYSFRGTGGAALSFSEALSQSQPVNKHHSIAESSAKRPAKRKSVDEDLKPKRHRSDSQRSGLQNEITSFEEETQGASLAPSDGPYDNRIFRCLVTSPAGRPIYTYKSPLELVEALRDAIKAHESLHQRGKILHRDISENNIIITDREKTGFSGILIDLDLAMELGSGPSSARCRTGTMEFMAIEVLRGVDHTYRHDLESFFYVLLWQCIRRGWKFVGKKTPIRSTLRRWYTGAFEEIATTKQGNMDKNAFEFVLEEFPEEFDCVKPLCRELRSVLFPIYEGASFTGTPKDPNVLYGPIIEAFDKAIRGMRTSMSEGEEVQVGEAEEAVGEDDGVFRGARGEDG